ATVTITGAEFYKNGIFDSRSHQIYIGEIAKLVVDSCYFHDGGGDGHHIKSRAAVTDVLKNRLFDNKGATSYGVDCSNGGVLTMRGNVVQQTATDTANICMLAFGSEGLKYTDNRILLDG